MSEFNLATSNYIANNKAKEVVKKEVEQQQIETTSKTDSEVAQVQEYAQNANQTISIYKDLSDEEVEKMLEQDKEPNLVSKALTMLKQMVSPQETLMAETPKDIVVPFELENYGAGPTRIVTITTNNPDPISIAANETIQIIHTINNQNYTYELSSDTAQNLDCSVLANNALCLKGKNLAVQSADEQFSKIYLLGDENTLKIGSKGKTLNADNISYLSDVGGNSIYTWDNPNEPDPQPTDEPEIQPALELSRGSEETPLAISAGETKYIKLVNPFNEEGKSYTYAISVKDGHAADANPRFEFQANGRLIIRGNYINIVASEGQADDIILLGNYCDVTTGDMDDTVRVGAPRDTKWTLNLYSEDIIDKNAYYNVEDTIHSTTNNKVYVPLYKTIGNEINTGDGDDYVTMLGKVENGVGLYHVDMGNGDHDYFMSRYNLAYDPKTNLEGVELDRKQTEIQPAGTTKPKIDGWDGWAIQGGSNCVTLSYINAIGQGGHKLTDFVEIIENRDSNNNVTSYDVTFPNYDKTKWPNPNVSADSRINSIRVTANEINNSTYVCGDRDTVVTFYALEQLIKNNKDKYVNQYVTKVYETLDKGMYIGAQGVLNNYFFGNAVGNFFIYDNNENADPNFKLTDERYKKILRAYLAGEFTMTVNGKTVNNQIIVHSNSQSNTLREQDYKLGKGNAHAYLFKNMVEDENGNILYVELINPYDDNDVVRYTWDYFKSKYRKFDITGGGISNEDIVTKIISKY